MAKLRAPCSSALALGLALASGACRTLPAEPAPSLPVTIRVEGTPNRVLDGIKREAIARRWRIADEGPDSLIVDFGTADARLPIGSEERLTEIHGTGLYFVRRTAEGTDVTLVESATYWHPDLGRWLRAPAGLLPGRDLVPEAREEPSAARAAR